MLARDIGHIPSTANLLAGLGVVALHQSDFRSAAALFEESLTLAQQVEDELLIAECLWGVAAVAAAGGQPVRAVRLWAAAKALDYPRAVIAVSAGRPVEERLLVPTRSRLQSGAFDAAWAKGQTMRREDAIAYALLNRDATPQGTKAESWGWVQHRQLEIRWTLPPAPQEPEKRTRPATTVRTLSRQSQLSTSDGDGVLRDDGCCHALDGGIRPVPWSDPRAPTPWRAPVGVVFPGRSGGSDAAPLTGPAASAAVAQDNATSWLGCHRRDRGNALGA